MLGLVVLLFATACEPSCKSSCRKLLRCDLGSSLSSVEDCEASCVFQERQYERDEADPRADALSAHKRCISRSRCDELAEGACYDEDVFIF